tara:strand:- start:3398 stop:4213 length:816 start_codon:yes stop_codon:yes gene_type:complete
MKPTISIIKYLIFLFLFFLIISIIIITKLRYSSIDKSAQNLYPKSSINIKYQLPWQREFYFNKIKEFQENPIGNNKIVFLGNSITAGGGNWNQRFNTKNIVNRGISGDYTEGILKRLNEIIFYKPRAVFLLIGVNEFFKDNSNNIEVTPAYVANNIFKIAEKIKNGSPSTTIYIQTIFPINNQFYMDVKMVDYNFLQNDYHPSINTQINEVNLILKNNEKFKVLDLHRHFLNKLNILDPIFSIDGVHLNQNGYQVWVDKISDLIQKLNSKL